MSLLTIPVRYLRVKWARALLLLCVFLLGVASMTALEEVSRTIGESFERKLVSFGANILITPRRDTLRVSYGGYTLGDVTLAEHSLSLAETMRGIDSIALRGNLAAIAPKLLTTLTVGEQTVGTVGVVWEEELAIKAYWEIYGGMPGPDSVLLGAAAGAALGLKEGDGIAVGGRSLPVAGVLRETGSDDDNVIFVSLPLLQDLTGRANEADFLEVAALCSACPIDDIVGELRAALPGQEVLALRQLAESQMYSVHFAQNLTFSVSLVILITACATVFMAMLSAVSERRKEIGIMRSVGFSRRHIFSVFALEALLIGLTAGALGFVLGHIVAGYVLENLHLVDDLTPAPAFRRLGFTLTSLGVGGLAVAASAFPAWKASRVEPGEVLAM